VSGETPGLDRREAIRRLVGAGLATAATADLAETFAAARPTTGGASGGPGYRPRFFEGDEYETVARLAALIIPSDETPGASEARVAEWIDFLLSESDAERQRLYRDGLGRLSGLSRERGRGVFASLPEAAQEEMLGDLGTADPAFFRVLKEDTVFGFYTSEVGTKELGLDGHSFHRECPGCSHPEHLDGRSVGSRGEGAVRDANDRSGTPHAGPGRPRQGE
jgi:hypothetical protein